ncbi:sulfite exporter TauE/SafE family protein [Campylobacter curvus]|uniref:Membrane protein (DsbD domain) n=1 Tax=Campylobacter curvus (strain 525.92) TaxID=360105 RepID=A7GWH9_CAMC5|nr:sulfite exporter TauE/SafE family protein [Campylobacter curvus]EAU01136.2 putative membrane protein (DsbD domain) [Campylobacter curvus 525.92]
MDLVNYLSVVSVAFFSSFSHCIGMCGGFLSLQSLFLRNKTKPQTILLLALYHLARILAYALLGALFGAFGGALALSGTWRAAIFFIVGILLVALGVALWVRGGLLKLVENDKISKFIASCALNVGKTPGLLNFIALGFLNGLLPCGVVYYFAAMAVASMSALNGAAIMLVFGLCTIPAMMSVALFFGLISERFKQIMFKISLVIIISNGIYLTFLGYMANG